MALALFAITLFVSAFILFLVQPIIGKMILPRLGGTPQVWNTCMVFFQMVLLLGYFYTHASSTRLKLRHQLILHCVLLFLPFLILLPQGPFNIEKFTPTLGANPLLSTLWFLFLVVGLPFFVVSTSAPLLQKWFGNTGHPASKDPYFLYGASNLGSLLALILYPFLIEQYMELKPQAWLWTISYGLLVVLVLACAALIWKPSGEAKLRLADAPPLDPPSEGQPVHPPGSGSPAQDTGVTATPPAPAPVPPAAKSTAFKKGKPQPKGGPPKPAAEPLSIRSDEMTTGRRLRWIALAAVPSSLMLGVTTHITTDLSPIPLFWLIPLTLYLLSFILVFSKWPVPWVEGPHTAMLYIQPIAICLMILVDILGAGSTGMWAPIAANVFAFTTTALVCHGELAKDRPGTRHLTEFYLLMSFGGMLGGMFNGIVAPVIFIYVWEFAIAVIAACFLRPKLNESNWIDDMFASFTEAPAAPAAAPGQKGQKVAHPRPRAIGAVAANEATSRTMDFALPAAVLVMMFVCYMIFGLAGASDEARGWRYFLVFGVPLVIGAFFYARPIRFGLTIAAVMTFHAILASRGESVLFADRSYFGILRVRINQATSEIFYTTLIHGHIDHGMNVFRPDKKDFWGEPTKDYSRLATTYYHRLGPAGIVMEKFNWAPGPENTYWADARMPASLVGMGATPLGTGPLPMGQLVDLWSEPAYATIGLGTGTMASYGRPFQHVHYYEIDNHVRRLSLPLDKKFKYYFSKATLPDDDLPFTREAYRGSKKPKTYFTYLKDAIRRGCEVQVLMGDARLRMDLPYKNHHVDPELGGGPENFYQMMVVDAFSSDAIPVHLITRQATEMYFKHLTEDGILCFHTSNRYVNLPLVVAAVASDLGYSYLRGHDQAPGKEVAGELGHYTSEWVMVAKKPEYLRHLSAPRNYETLLQQAKQKEPRKFDVTEPYWTTPVSSRKYMWTDDHSNLINVIK